MTESEDLRVERIVAASGNTLVASVSGDPDAPAVVLLHGGGQTRHSWHRTVQSLAARGYLAMAYDARGHGDSDWPADADYGLARLADDLESVLERLGSAPTLIGASMGGLTVLHALGRHEPSWASAMVLVDIAPRVNPAGSKRIVDFMTARPDGFASVDEAADAVAAYNPHRVRPRDTRGLMKNLRLRADGRLHWHWDPRLFDSLPVNTDAETAALLEPCSRIKIPALLVRGQHSDIVTEDGIEELKSRLPQLEVAQVGGAGHMIAGDRNSAFDGAILPFLERRFPAAVT
jgi:pimeloyl-ACP methyl ester carboxylesterase